MFWIPPNVVRSLLRRMAGPGFSLRRDWASSQRRLCSWCQPVIMDSYLVVNRSEVGTTTSTSRLVKAVVGCARNVGHKFPPCRSQLTISPPTTLGSLFAATNNPITFLVDFAMASHSRTHSLERDTAPAPPPQADLAKVCCYLMGSLL